MSFGSAAEYAEYLELKKKAEKRSRPSKVPNAPKTSGFLVVINSHSRDAKWREPLEDAVTEMLTDFGPYILHREDGKYVHDESKNHLVTKLTPENDGKRPAFNWEQGSVRHEWHMNLLLAVEHRSNIRLSKPAMQAEIARLVPGLPGQVHIDFSGVSIKGGDPWGALRAYAKKDQPAQDVKD